MREQTTTVDDPAGDAHSQAFKAVGSTIERLIVRGGEVWRMTQICALYLQQLARVGIEIDSYRADLLKRKLQQRFGDVLQFVQASARCKSTLVLADVSMEELAEAMMEAVSTDMDAQPSVSSTGAHSNEAVDLYHAAVIIRQQLLAVENTLSWPPTPEECDDEEVTLVPDSLFNILGGIVSGDGSIGAIPSSGRVSVADPSTRRRILSIAQDIFYCTRNERIKTPKHVLLPLAVHHLTRSARIVTLLNIFGHGMAHSQVQELDTALAEQALAQEDGVPIPPHIDRSIEVIR